MGRTHPSKEYLLVFGMSMMSMKPLFPAKGMVEVAQWLQAEQRMDVGMGQCFFMGEKPESDQKGSGGERDMLRWG